LVSSAAAAATLRLALFWRCSSRSRFVLLIIGNALWGVAVYFGLQNTKYAIPEVIALGIITSFLYSVIVFEDPVTWWRLLGLGLVILGIYFIQ
jgi:multidrug transporter EmrE-like cation transporter